MSKPKKPNRKLQHERELRGWSQQKVASEIDTDEKRIGVWERGESAPSPFYREKLCDLYGKNAQELGFLGEVTEEEDRKVAPIPTESSLTQSVTSVSLDGHQPIQLFIPDNAPHIVTIHIQQQVPATTRTYSEQSDNSDTQVTPIKHITLPTNSILSDQQSSTGDIFSLGILALALAQQQHGWNLEELQFRVLQKIRNVDDATQQQGSITSRRQALKFLIDIPSAIFGLIHSSDTEPLANAGEILPLYAASIPACWSLYYSGPNEWVKIEEILPSYFLHLTTLAQQSSKHQKAAASLLSQIHQLGAEVTLTRENFNVSLAHCKQAFFYARLADDTNLQAASLIREANTLFHRNRSTIQINQQVAQYVQEVSPLLRGRIYSELSTSYAELGQEQEAYRYTGLAHDSIPDRPEADSSFSYTHSDHYILFFNDMWTYLRLDQPKKAWEAISRAGTFVSEVVTPRRMELLKHVVIAAIASGDLDLSKVQFETLVKAAATFGSDLHFSELYDTHQLMITRWPGERQVKALADLYQ